MNYLLSFTLFLCVGLSNLVAIDLVQNPQVRLDQSGNAISVWQKEVGGSHEIWTASYSLIGDSWSTAVRLSVEGEDSFNPLLEMDSAGNAVVVWIEAGATRTLKGVKFLSGGAWSVPTIISASDQIVNDNFKLRMNDDDVAMVVWPAFSTLTSTTRVYASRLPLAGSWSVPTALSD